ncbi:MAG: hypothetical protein R8P61_30295 [Bacteroidia bacterium]|nr:hypothetical protein [Bacteroidia bacterium]
MKKYITLVLLAFIACEKPSTTEKTETTAYQLIEEDGIYVEVFDSTYTDQNRFTDNNRIYLPGRAFAYDFFHQTKEGKKQSFKDGRDPEKWATSWHFVEPDAEAAVKQVIIKSRSGLSPFVESIPDYNQTIVSYDYPDVSGNSTFNSMSGVIENEKNTWIHPPRDKYFRILELNPFPFVQAPYEVGNSWDWSLNIGAAWGDERWKEWEGVIENTYQYEIKEKKLYQTALGEIECIEIHASATSDLGLTQLVSLFNQEYGFVKLDYTNIDSSKTILELVAVKEPA